MLARVQLAIAAALALVAIVLGAVLVLGDGDATVPVEAAGAVGPNGWVGAERPQIPASDFTLSDENGREVSLSDFRGQPVLLTFLYTTCADTCPLTADQIRGALDDIDADVPALAVSVDPPADTARKARSFLLDRKLTGRMGFLLGNEPTLKPVWDAYGIQRQGDDFEHSASTVLIDKRGRQRVGFPTSQLTSAGLVHDLRRLLREPA